MTETTPTTTDSAATCTLILPPTDLKDKVLIPGKDFGFDLQAIKRAEIALEELSVNFKEWIIVDTETLSQAQMAAEASAFSPESLDALFNAAHDLKGQACTLGYPLAGSICHSLCQMIDGLPDQRRISAILVKQHVDAVMAIVREEITNADHPVARAVFKKLREVTIDFVIQEVERVRADSSESQELEPVEQPELSATGAVS